MSFISFRYQNCDYYLCFGRPRNERKGLASVGRTKLVFVAQQHPHRGIDHHLLPLFSE